MKVSLAGSAAGVVALSAVLTVGMTGAGRTGDRAATRLAFVTALQGRSAELMEHGARQAARDLGVSLSVASPGPGPGFAQAMADVVATRPNAITVAVGADDDLLRTSVEAAAAGIPVVGVGAIGATATSAGALLVVGSNEHLAGVAAGHELGRLAVTNALCLEVATATATRDRCAGAAAGLAATGGSMDELLALDPAGDPSGVRGAIAARLRADPTIDGILMTDPTSVPAVVAAAAQAGTPARVALATFGISAGVLDALEARQLAFVVDEQPYRQGYLAVLAMTSYTRDGILLGGGEPVEVGYELVKPGDVARVRTLAQRGQR